MSSFVAFLSGADQYGRWVPDSEVTASAYLGGSTVDFSQALFKYPVPWFWSQETTGLWWQPRCKNVESDGSKWFIFRLPHGFSENNPITSLYHFHKASLLVYESFFPGMFFLFSNHFRNCFQVFIETSKRNSPATGIFWPKPFSIQTSAENNPPISEAPCDLPCFLFWPLKKNMGHLQINILSTNYCSVTWPKKPPT